MAAATLFLGGDVMTGRGVDQILPHPGRPRLLEAWAASARDYVALAEAANGPIGAPRDFAYIWGDALAELERRAPGARIANLETAVTTSEDACPGKGINYRMHPANAPCLSAARLDCVSLANNHVLDWGRAGLVETLATLDRLGIAHAGAGRDAAAADAPAILPLADGTRVLVFAVALESSGVPPEWAAGPRRPGVSFLPAASARAADDLAGRIARHRRDGDLVVLSIHWGPNWGYGVGRDERAFAHALVERAAVDVVHGHSSHHAKGIELRRGRPILYGCGDLIDDYEGIAGWEEFRPDLALLYFATLAPGAGLRRLEVVAMRRRRMRLERASAADDRWIAAMLGRVGPAVDGSQYEVAGPEHDGKCTVAMAAPGGSP